MRVLVTGGAGYLGSHVVLALVQAGHQVDVVDDFSRGTPASLARGEAISRRRVRTHAADVADIDSMERIFAGAAVDAVVHLAGLRSASECVDRPLDAYETNLTTTFTLLRCMTWYGVDRLVLSSSAAVYGDATAHGTAGSPDGGTRFAEDAPLAPASPLGRTMVTNEQLLQDVTRAGAALRVAVLRCFNTVGADPSGRIGEDRNGAPSSLLTRLGEVALGLRGHVEVHGGNHPTPDGTALRDYVHVSDVAAGHVAALAALERPGEDAVRTWNLGTGHGSSVREVLRTFEQVTGREVSSRVLPAPAGTIASSVADVTRSAADLGWTARRDLAEICRDHWRWQREHPRGYPSTLVPETPWRGGVGHRLRLVPPLSTAVSR
ncbi:UDP-glucose 4-epimerase GalE [Isoptericola sp. S6320L]|uniref:UDP-glucose 4-epimerase GalE n=1 Tax=Isoptericola sp. S6320L TaxID=2926411 RepID=UPI001FF47948|nr:UDP-glucose 4-epimerase GalE [Isoptericola sp. S6320L]MCK0116707.1 UDP-glucose 4-epimerase GalE [Isoptericola sp. S6320L]